VPNADSTSTTSTSKSYSDQSNGTHYFHIRAKIGTVWSSTDHYAIKIDGTKPGAPTNLSATYDSDDEEVDLDWESGGDSHSGISYYMIYRGTNSDFGGHGKDYHDFGQWHLLFEL
jgi:hypothetical protein